MPQTHNPPTSALERETERLVQDPDFFDLYRNLFKAQHGHFTVGEVYPAIIPNDFFFNVSYGLNLCIANLSAHPKKSAGLNLAYKKALFLCHMLIASVPGAALQHIETYAEHANLKHRLAFDQIPQEIATLPECNPLNGLWYAAFIGHTASDTLAKRRPTLYKLAATLREMGWGREIALDIDSLLQRIIISSQQIAITIGAADATKVTEILSGLLRGLRRGHVIDYPKVVQPIRDLLNTHETTPLPHVLNEMVIGYLFFPPHKNIPAEVVEAVKPKPKDSFCIPF